jgi:hypothetical protein
VRGPSPAARGAGRPLARGALAVAAVALAGLVLAACSSSPTSGTGSTTTTTGRSTTTTGRSTTTSGGATTTAPSTTTSTTGHPGVATCLASQLSIVPQQGSGAAGTIAGTVSMTNTSSTTCTLYGYPGMQLLDAQGGDIPTTVVRGGVNGGPAAASSPPSLVTLAPGQAAAFAMQYEDVPVGNETSCPTSARAEITPPNDTTPAVVALAISPCDNGTVHVSPVFAAG